jgi:hypothetical protein
MPLVFKLVTNTSIDNTLYQLKDAYEGVLNLELLNELLIFWGFNINEISSIKFIIDSEQIKDPNMNYLITKNEDKIIYVFTNDINLRNKFQTIFTKTEINTISKVETTLEIIENQCNETKDCKSEISENDKIIPELSPEIINSMNLKTIELFNDNDFRNLLSIYLRKPELYNTLLRYIQNNDIIEASLYKKPKEISRDEVDEYTKLINELKKLELGFDDNVIMDKLIKYSGHLNLTLRGLILDYCHQK